MPPPKPAPTRQDRLAIGLLAAAYLAVALPAVFLTGRWFIGEWNAEQQRIEELRIEQQRIYTNSNQDLEALKAQRQALAEKLQKRNLQNSSNSENNSAPLPEDSLPADALLNTPAILQSFMIEEPDTLLPYNYINYTIKIDETGRVVALKENFSTTNQQYPELTKFLTSALFTPAKRNGQNKSCTLNLNLRSDAQSKLEFSFTPLEPSHFDYPKNEFYSDESLSAHVEAWKKNPNSPAIPTEKPAPIYPYNLKDQGIEGKVILLFRVGKDGRVYDLSVSSSTNPGFEKAAMDCVQMWRFLPAKEEGQPVSTKVRLPLNFKLQ